MSDCIIIYTDGAAEPNPGPGGYGVVLLTDGNRKELSGGFKLTTNNRMELLAVIAGLEALTQPTTAIVISDSQYVVDSIQKGYVSRWKRNGWRLVSKKRAKNVDLWERFLNVAGKHKVTFKWVKGHAGTPENERCDQLAVAATKGANLPVDQGYLEELKLQDAERETTPDLFSESTNSASHDNANAGGTPAGQCPKCGASMIKKRPKASKRKPGQTYYFEWVTICSGCKRIYLEEADKRSI